MKTIVILLFGAFIYHVTMFKFTIDKTDLTYANSKYFTHLTFNLRRASRRSPYVLNIYQCYTTPMGNNLTMSIYLYEIIAGREILTPMRWDSSLCVLLKDPIFGKIVSDCLPKGWTCPFHAGCNNWTNLELKVDHFPLVPFTYSSISVRACLHFDAFINKEPAAKAYACGKVTQKVYEDIKTEKKKSIIKT